MKVASLSELAQSHIQEWIATAELQPGQQLKEEEIARRLAISRPPVREAFKALEAKGLVERKPRRGVFVTEVTRKDVWEIYTLKAVLYEMAAGLATSIITEAEIDRLDQMTRKMEDLVRAERPDIIGYQNVHQKFHFIILNIADNGRLKTFATMLHEQVRRLSYQSLQDHNHLSASLMYHKQIVQAFRDRDSAAAEKLTRIHVLEALNALHHAPDKEVGVALVNHIGGLREEMGVDDRVKGAGEENGRFAI